MGEHKDIVNYISELNPHNEIMLQLCPKCERFRENGPQKSDKIRVVGNKVSNSVEILARFEIIALKGQSYEQDY